MFRLRPSALSTFNYVVVYFEHCTVAMSQLARLSRVATYLGRDICPREVRSD